MVTLVQLLSGSLILVSFLLVLAVPVILASPGEWEKSKDLIFQAGGIWSGLVLTTALFNSFVV